MSNRRKRIIVQKPGGYGVFRIDDTPIEDPQSGEVQLDVKTCGINFADVAVRLGLYQAAKGAYPLCPGLEFAGVVKNVSKDITVFEPGDRVFGATRFGAYSTRINCPAEQLWRLPATWDFIKGASFPVVRESGVTS